MVEARVGGSIVERPDNAILRALPEADFERLRPHLREVHLELGDVVHAPSDPVQWVCWVERGLLSIVSSDVEGDSVETGMVGREGASGLVEACGGGTSYLTVLVQIEGRGWRAPAALCRELAETSSGFRQAVMQYAEIMLAEGRQSVVCQARHGAEARCARWLMESRERSGVGDSLPLTQEYLAAMLGVQRTTVTNIAGALQRRGLIRYGRGRIDIVDPEGLEAAACDCRRSLAEHRAQRAPAAAYAAAAPAPRRRAR
jgi:CRP-like cAMP-binding protein